MGQLFLSYHVHWPFLITTEAKQYIVHSGRSGLDNAMAKLVVEGDEGNFVSGDLGETDGGNW